MLVPRKSTWGTSDTSCPVVMANGQVYKLLCTKEDVFPGNQTVVAGPEPNQEANCRDQHVFSENDKNLLQQIVEERQDELSHGPDIRAVILST